MAKVTMLNTAGEQVGDIELKDEVFGIEINEFAVHEVIKNYLANQRQGTQSAKTRGEVRGGGRKPFRQKGTGRGRQGSRTSPSHIGGGVVFAPKPRSYRYSVPKKVKKLAIKSVLTSKVQENEIIVLDSLTMEEPKTKEMLKILKNIGAAKKSIIVTREKNDNVIRSAANIAGVETAFIDVAEVEGKREVTGGINAYQLLNATSFIVTKDAVEKIEEVYS